MWYAVMSIMLAILATASTADQFAVLDVGTKAVIVYDSSEQGEAVSAYEDLAAYLKKSTGQDFTVVPEREFESAGQPVIYVGNCPAVRRAIGHDLQRLDRDAYMVVVEKDRVMLAGPRPWSTYWAVCQFLEDYVGVRWLIPGPLGEDVPQHDRIVVPMGSYTYHPAILWWSGAYYGGPWSLRQRMHPHRHDFHHNLYNIFTPDMYDEHPEYFPLRNGKRYRPSGKDDQSWQPCFTAPGTIQVAADAARAAFRTDPDRASFSFGVNDSYGYCECETCKANSRPVRFWGGFAGDHSYLYYSWLNKIAENLEKDYPDKMLGCLAYHDVILPPPGLKLHRNIIPYFSSNRADYWDPEFRANDMRFLASWGSQARQMGIYEYAYGTGFAIPRIYNHLFQDAIKFAVAHNVRGFYAEVYPNWGLDGHKLYVMSRIVHNPEVDVDAITEEWNERMFREAAEPMKRYFALCEQAWRDQHTGKGHWSYRLLADPKQFQIFTPEIIQKCTAYLDEAASLAKSDLVKQRLHFFRKTWDVTVVMEGIYWAGYKAQQLIDKGASVDEVAAALREAAEWPSGADLDAFIQAKVGDDPIAFYPLKQSWAARRLISSRAVATDAKHWLSAYVANGEIQEARKGDNIDAVALRKAIDEQVTKIFGSEGSETYRHTVAQIRAMYNRVAAVVKTDTAPTINGVLDDPIWQKADVLTDFIKWDKAVQAQHMTRVRLAHDGANLYVALECEQDTSNLVLNSSGRDGLVWRDDSVQIFISADMTEPYTQFIINAAGTVFDQRMPSTSDTGEQRLSFSINGEWKTNIEPGRWIAELRLPLADIGADLSQSQVMRMNFVRNVIIRDPQYGPQFTFSAWFPNIGEYADPLSRGWIVFE